MAYYWVNLGDTFKEVLKGEFLWAPAHSFTSKGNKTVKAGWKAVPNVVKGDIIFCYWKGNIIYTAIAKMDAYESIKPSAAVFSKWPMDGYKIDVDLLELDHMVSIDSFRDTIYDLYNDYCVPKLLNSVKKVSENYMISIPDSAANIILQELGDAVFDLEFKAQKYSPNLFAKKETKTKKSVDRTVKESIVKSRVGQGQFRKDVLALWDNTCPVTDIKMPSLLVASHINPWNSSNNEERLDAYNGLPLSPSIDKLFDKGYVSFSNDGHLLKSDKIDDTSLRLLGIDPEMKISGLTEKHAYYLAKHRELFKFEAKD
ncbi:HNH endonuclease [Marinomonas aquiplantarum]|uniref:HNH endonuclease n=1 Tax=Marinomonas aquiplantarum TaxID=491951 RepID=A0A366CXS3_9GAMM|nr:HNH endonuclease signature motif containing protein [Marinomonas aquiplantarum]RBO82613.1 HNH endonuclease [Marinomonas aquiplantarum]